ncbi:MAG TPA: YdcF family protein [Bacillota bacterium]|nr:YdcF family protein [Bacillota bacterium]
MGKDKGTWGIVLKVLVLVIILAIVLEIGLYIFVASWSNNESPERSDLILVLGCKIHDDRPSLSLQYRLDKAIELYEAGLGDWIIVSGGQGADEVMAEAELMKQYLTNRNIPEEVIFKEAESTSTWENINFSLSIMDEIGAESAVVVTNDFHLYRSVTMAKRAGIKATGAPAPSVDWLKHPNRVRETLAIVKFWVWGK